MSFMCWTCVSNCEMMWWENERYMKEWKGTLYDMTWCESSMHEDNSWTNKCMIEWEWHGMEWNEINEWMFLQCMNWMKTWMKWMWANDVEWEEVRSIS